MGRMTINEYEMIAMAAKAVGIHWCMWDWARLNSADSPVARDMLWNPLENDGEASRLLSSLKMSLSWNPDGTINISCDGHTITQPPSPVDGDAKQLRYAIVRMAAIVGRKMP